MTAGGPPAWAINWHDTIDSTSEEGRRRAASGQFGPLWIAARTQVTGRGRLGRPWVSPQGNLFATALFIEPGGLTAATRVPFAAGLAVVDACRMILPQVEFALKWPNDVRVSGAKLCGILVESGQTQGALWVLAGIGVNVRVAPAGAGQAATCLLDLGAPEGLQPEMVLEHLNGAFARRLAQARADFPGLLRDWCAVGEGLGQTVTAGPADGRIEGVFEGLADDGGLILRLRGGQTHIIRAGDVELVRKVD